MRHLIVPIQVNALRTSAPLNVRRAMADFSRLPFFDGAQDRNSEFAYVSEDMVTRPFEDGLMLDSGVHLHWHLPAALRRGLEGRNEDDGAQFPAAPNMWLITRTGIGAPKRWIVESDYIHPYREGAQPDAVCFPIGAVEAGAPPFRYMGRALPENEWHLLAEPHDHLRKVTKSNSAQDGHPLTALGYGEPTFASFYPNCRSVFGFCDRSVASGSTDATYQIAGWYRDRNPNLIDDFCAPHWIDGHFVNRYAKALRERTPWPEESPWPSFRHRAFEEVFGWAAPPEHAVPERSLYLAEITLNANGETSTPPTELDVNVSLGNTATEALSSRLARTHIAPDDKAEDMMEALNLLGELDHLRVDTGPKFLEARHTNGFQGSSAGSQWQITRRKVANGSTDRVAAPKPKVKSDTPKNKYPALPEAIAHLLNRLNLQQAGLDKARLDLASVKTRTFSDWYRYMLCAYPPPGQADLMPDIDQARYLIDAHDLPEIERLTAKINELSADVRDREHELRGQLVQISHENGLANDDTFELVSVGAPRFWQPHEPVVLLSGPSVPNLMPKPEPKQKDQEDQPMAVISLPDIPLHHCIDVLVDKLRDIPAKPANTSDDWVPMLIEWEAELWPTPKLGKSAATGQTHYTPEHVSASYRMRQNKVDLARKPSAPDFHHHPDVLQGCSILTPHAAPLLIKQLDTYLETHLYPLFDLDTEQQGGTALDRAGPEYAQAARKWYFSKAQDERVALFCALEGTPNGLDDATAVAWAQIDTFIGQALLAEEAISPEFGTLSQSLSGFNAALLGQKQTMQLSIGDPLAFADDSRSDYAGFAREVKTAIGKFNRTAPQPMAGFTPLRAGALNISRVRLVDSFGRSALVPHERLVDISVAHTLRGDISGHSTTPGNVVLPPRLAQPARLLMRWRAGHGRHADEVETSSHPATSPICGWLVPNSLDDSIAVYHRDGIALGTLDLNGKWRAPPGAGRGVAHSADIPNSYLRRVVQWIETASDGIRSSFHSALDTALENVDPANWAEHEDIALLMGRPIAVTRFSLNLELMGHAALDPGSDVYERALQNGHNRHTDSAMIQEVKFPIRLGEHAQLNDGLLGYWKEWDTADGPVDGLSAQFNAPQADTNKISLASQSHRVHCSNDGMGPDNDFNVELSLDADPLTVTALIDPRARIHATSGILPTRAISVPFDQVQAALQAIEVTFDVAPILMPRRDLIPREMSDDAKATAVVLPLPQEPGYSWRWVDGENNFEQMSKIAKTDTMAGPATALELRDGYLVLRRKQRDPKTLGEEE